MSFQAGNDAPAHDGVVVGQEQSDSLAGAGAERVRRQRPREWAEPMRVWRVPVWKGRVSADVHVDYILDGCRASQPDTVRP